MLHLASVAAMDSPSDGQKREDFAPLVDEMNELTDMFRRSIARRKANNRRKFLKKQQAAHKAELVKTESEEKETSIASKQLAPIVAEAGDKETTEEYATNIGVIIDENQRRAIDYSSSTVLS